MTRPSRRLDRLARVGASVRGFLPPSWEVPIRYRVMAATGSLEPAVAMLPRWVAAGDQVVDVGANFGTYTFALSRLGAAVTAFEPNPLCVSALEAWDHPGVTVEPIGLSDKQGTAELSVPVSDGLARHTRGSFRRDVLGESISVAVRTLDSFGLDRVDFMKIDVEGHELAVLRGATETIDRCRPKLLVEIEQRHLTEDVRVADVVEALAALRYEGWLLTRGGAVSAGEFVAAIHQPLVGDSPGPGYANMFLFRPN